MPTLIEQASSRSIGFVEYVSPSEIKVLLDIEAPQSTAINSGIPTAFPRINGFVLIPNERGAIVGLITWLGVERSAFPKRTGMQDFGLVDLPFPLRKISLSPLGTLINKPTPEGEVLYNLERGVHIFPSVGDTVLIPTPEQLRCIVEASSEEDKRVPIGTSPLANNATVSIDPDKLFGRHLAVLGNTGSGKSCSVAGIIRWTLEKALASTDSSPAKGARFIVLDPNGEYSQAFSSLTKCGYKVKVFGFTGQTTEKDDLLPLPAWLWNAEEWAAFTRAAPGVQQPLLMQAIRSKKNNKRNLASKQAIAHRNLRILLDKIQSIIDNATYLTVNAAGKKELFQTITHTKNSVDALAIDDAILVVNEIIRKADKNRAGWIDGDFDPDDFHNLSTILWKYFESSPVEKATMECEDAPIKFDVESLTSEIQSIASGVDGKTEQAVSTLLMRIDAFLKNENMRPIIAPELGPESFEEWMDILYGTPGPDQHDVIILNLQFVPYDILHIAIAVLSRIIFMVAQHNRRITDTESPTILVLEEAHTFIKGGPSASDGTPDPSTMCRRTFERIAREGRKFGLGLVLASQRPSELSATVLSQCNTFLLHRIVNDRDQDLVCRLVPDNMGGLLKELPSLPSRSAFMLGWATPVPVLVKMNKLPEELRPKSPDPSFWQALVSGKQTMDHELIAGAMTNTSVCVAGTDKPANKPAAHLPENAERDPLVDDMDPDIG